MTMTERHFTKTVETIAKDDDEQVAISAVLVPDEVDRQLDFLRPDGVRNLFNPDADIGVMHAVFDNSAATSEHRILEEPETIGGEEYAAGTWVERREYHDDKLWALVKDGVLEGRSIGGELEETREYAPGDVPDDVAFPADVPGDRGATEIVDGSVSEVSDVDVPAVPNAEHAVVKSDLAKDILDEVAGEDEFVQAMTQRGHSEEDAERLWAFMDSVGKMAAKDVDMSVPQAAANAAERAFDAREEHGNPNDCLTEQGWARARQLRDNDQIDADAWREVRAFFRRSQEQEGRAYDADTHEPPDCAWYEWHVWGGQAAWDKAERVVEQLEREQTVNEPAESGADSPDKDAMTTTDTDDEPDDSGEKSLDEVDDETLGARIKSALGLGADADADDGADAPEESAEKAGQTLSARNVNYAKEVHDDAEEMLRDAGVTSHSATVRTYHEDKTDEFERDSHYEDKAADPATVKEEDPCWDGYTMVGLDGDGNPRCVPDEDVEDVDFEQAVAYEGQAEPPAKAADEPDTDEQKANEPAESGADLGKLDADRVAKLAERADEINT